MVEQDRFDDRHGAGADDAVVASPPRTAVAEEQVVYRAEGESGVHGAARPSFDLAATLGGLLAALGALVLLSGLLSAIIGATSQTGADETSLSVGAAIGALIALFLALLAGGWVAGRMARHHGAKHGLTTALWMILLVALLAGLGAVLGSRFDIMDRLGLSQVVGGDGGTIALITALVALGVMLLGGWLGGRLGGRHHSAGAVEVVETRHGVAEERGGIISGGSQR